MTTRMIRTRSPANQASRDPIKLNVHGTTCRKCLAQQNVAFVQTGSGQRVKETVLFCIWARAGVCAKNEVQQTLAVWIAMRCSEHSHLVYRFSIIIFR